MKKTISFNLEEDIVNEIEKYQKEHKLSSRSAALERIILKLTHVNNLLDVVKINSNGKLIIDDVREEDKDNKKDNDKIKHDNLELNNSIEDTFLNMPD